MWEICRIGAQVRPEIVLCIRFVKKAPSAAIDDRPSSNRKEEVLVIAIEKKDSSVYLCLLQPNKLFKQIVRYHAFREFKKRSIHLMKICSEYLQQLRSLQFRYLQ
ncbi:hypothetical protein ALC53_00093 [Atta colombica]|uniref:Uncharacterized protein n=1 Tax=Atta colombica TaxID=520822 RepID=A0A195BZ14_9HYME|nr:hypothetical protein ALC53_00093 [Atta colombica]